MGAPVRGQRTGSAVSGFQRLLKNILGLEFQLDAVDYSAKNFVHADLDYEVLRHELPENVVPAYDGMRLQIGDPGLISTLE